MMKRHSALIVLSQVLLSRSDGLPPPGQPTHKGEPGKFEIIGNSLVSGQQCFLGSSDKVYIIDKAENNPAQINGHPAWASEWTLSSNKQRPIDVMTNTFCAGGGLMGNGTWVNIGGNPSVGYGGEKALNQNGEAPYNDGDGRKSIRLLDPCDGDCNWTLSPEETSQRWYPSVETLVDGSLLFIGGSTDGGYVNVQPLNNPTYEYFPKRGDPVQSPVLARTLPTNLFPLTWLLPSGRLLLQSNRETVLLDLATNTETPLEDIPDAVRTYPASAGTVMLPLTPKNNWTATIMFCGGSDVPTDRWLAPDFEAVSQSASTSCVKITPDVTPKYEHDDPLPEVRTMGNLILLPDQTIFCLNGAKTGTAGYGNNTWAVGQSYADGPLLMPIIYNPKAPGGKKWSRDGLSASTVPRMYHSSATLLPDGSVFVTGSNPNSDYNATSPYPTEYRTELFFPSYFKERRPQPKGIPPSLSYGGYSFDITLDSEDLKGDVNNVKNTTVILIRTGFSTHTMNMGQRLLELETSYTGYNNGTAIMHVSQIPPNPAILAPGPAYMFVVVDGVPSIGVQVMVGSGKVEKQETLPVGERPASTIVRTENTAEKSNSGLGYDYRSLGEQLPAWITFVAALVLGL